MLGAMTPDGAAQGASARVVLVVGELRLDLVVPLHLAVADLRQELGALAARAGARTTGSATLHDVAGRMLDPSLLLAEAGVAEGGVLVLREPTDQGAAAPAHLVPDAVGGWVAGRAGAADPELRASLAVLTAGAAALLCLGAVVQWVERSAGAPWPGLLAALVAGVAAGCGLRVLRSGEETAGASGSEQAPQWWAALSGGVVLAGVAVAGHGAEHAVGRGGAGVGAGVGVAFALVVLALGCAGVGVALPGQPAWASRVRSWSWVPCGLAVAVGAVPGVLSSALQERWGVTVPALALSSGLVVLLVLGAGMLSTWATDLAVVRPLRDQRRWGQEEPLAVRLDELRRTVLALDVLTVLAAVVLTPAVVRSGPTGVALWGALVLALALRVRGERWRDRVLVSGGGALVLLVLGVVTGLATMEVALVGPGLALAALVAVLAASSGGAAALARPGVALDRTVRVLLPSIWLLGSGLVPGWSG